MSDAASPVDDPAPAKPRKSARNGADQAGSGTGAVESEARSFAADAAAAREKLIAIAVHRAKARRAIAEHWAKEKAVVAGQAVRTRPVTAIGAALGVGVIIGLLAAR
ncbi:MAG TPA: hypothetical protein VHZ26_09635 [Caulobacteraceae bacterium]|jgi:ElaB/YqjD/DUF883 family membrane-anchored ribosome-binding protein|nr:hypothetical protein [Caulobacteraceae bacterium]